ncbi:2-haloalkanoic acid dehalogenase [Pseudoalteromonas luteoviolacea B = ATCC 29581]|nr:2-haloalkanoic acid dehalogenase [Pseudoalteromonas luteoviolacea B = ATCC 29581]
MRFNRAIGTIKAISFDLDDTLYDNRPIIKAAVNAMLNHVKQFPQWVAAGEHFWRDCRRAALEQDETLEGDVTRWRQVALHYAFRELGFNEHDIKTHANAAYQAFAEARSKIEVSDEVLQLLSQLRQKYSLIAITNGNVEVDEFNLKDCFDFVLLAGKDGSAKPNPDLYLSACQRLAIAPDQLLHIGDSLDTDVLGALVAGCRSGWLINNFTQYQSKSLPDFEFNDIRALSTLL